VRDYVFYFAPADPPGYGSAARFFFTTFYPNHVAHDAKSLESLIRILHDDVTNNGVQQIREVVLVAHGSPVGLQVHLLDATDDADLLNLNPYSLSELQAKLQPDAPDGLTDFGAKRTAVLDHFSPDAFVTLRVCRFGQSAEGMYALYSFFGGAVNVYAPLKYQFFGSVFLKPGARFQDRLAFHDHLVRQRLLPAGRHTPARATALVRAMEHEQSFSEPFELASMVVGGGEPPEYGALMDSLNAAQLSPELKTTFQQHGFELSSAAQASVAVKDAAWRVLDIVKQDQESFPVEYRIGEELDAQQQHRSLVVQGTVLGGGPDVPLQVFLDDFQDAELKGEITILAYKLDGDPDDAPNVTRFGAVSDLLAANGASGSTFNMGDVDLRAEIAAHDESLRPADNATITVAEDHTLDSGLHNTAWLITPTAAGTAVEIRLTHPYTVERVRSHTLKLLRHFALDEQRAAYEADVLAWAGTNPDSPGVELAASLDRLSLDDLVELIAYLHSPYDPGRVVQLNNAQEALQRKAGYRQWSAQRYPTGADIPFPTSDPVTELSLGQIDDLAERSYAFKFDDNWREVRESISPRPSFHNDLFLEESLVDRFPNVLSTWAAIEDEDVDSPSASAPDSLAKNKPGQERFSSTTTGKDTFTPPDIAVGCEEYRTAIRRIQELKDLPFDQLSAALAAETTPGKKSYFEIYEEVGEQYGRLQQLWTLTEFGEFLELPEIPANNYEFGKLALKGVTKVVDWEFGETLLEFLEGADAVVVLPFLLWLETLEKQQEGVEKNEAYGRLTGVRTWLRELDKRAAQAPHLLDDLTVDLTGYTDQQVEDAYADELNEGNVMRFMLYIEDFHRGFTEGATLMQDRWPFLRDDVEQIASKALYDGSTDTCRTTVLVEEGVLDLDALRVLVVHQMVEKMLSHIRRV
jgi:hypothetical protein